MGLANPVTLHQLDFFRPIDAVEILDQTVTVGGNAHGPLA